MRGDGVDFEDPKTPAPGDDARPSTAHQPQRPGFSTPEGRSVRPASVGKLNIRGMQRGGGGSSSARGSNRPKWNSDYTPNSHSTPVTRAPSRAEGGSGSPLPASPLTERGTSPTRLGSTYRARLADSPYAASVLDARRGGSGAGGRSGSANGGLTFFQVLRPSPTPTSRSWSPMGARTRVRTPRADPTGTLVSTPREPHKPFEQRIAQTVYGKSSSLGVQYNSNRKTAPTCSFGRASRDEHRRKLWVNEDVAAANQASSPEVHTCVPVSISSFGPQSESSYQTSPSVAMSTTERFPHLSPRKRSPLADMVPGPGAYNTGNEMNILRGQSERVTFAESPRFGRKVFISEAHAMAQNDGFAGTPGPGAFETATDTLGPQVRGDRATSARPVFPRGKRCTEFPGRTSAPPRTPAPYGGEQPGLLIGRGEKGAMAFPRATRDGRAHTYLNQEADKINMGHVGRTPGPGRYDLEGDFKGDGVGTRALSPNRNPVNVSIGSAPRFGSYANGTPGPGAYFED